MFAHERHQSILDTLQEGSPLSVSALVKSLNASPATIRRDLTFLEKTGKIVRTHGGVASPDHSGEMPFDRKSKAALKAKLALVKTAASLVRPNDTVFIDAGTTALETGRHLLTQESLTLFTNSIPLLAEAARLSSRCRVISIGGEVRSISQAFTGAMALDWLSHLRVDIAFLGASGIDIVNGPCTTEISEAGIKAQLIAHAARVVLLVDASKWSQTAAIRYADWSQIHDVVTDYTPTRAERSLLSKSNTRIHPTAK